MRVLHRRTTINSSCTGLQAAEGRSSAAGGGAAPTCIRVRHGVATLGVHQPPQHSVDACREQALQQCVALHRHEPHGPHHARQGRGICNGGQQEPQHRRSLLGEALGRSGSSGRCPRYPANNCMSGAAESIW